MKREIKFRAFGANMMGKVYAYAEDFCSVFWGNTGREDEQPCDVATEDIQVMQYTGLCDKNGKEIYEGDILIKEGYLPQQIWFEDGSYLIGRCQESDHSFFQHKAETYEVIGNIYQNAELLNN